MVRHGETAWNLEKRVQGSRDIPLNSRGEKQAAALERAFRDVRADAVYTSPLVRAATTAARIVRQKKLVSVPVAKLAELNHGLWEGLNHAGLREKYAAQHDLWCLAPHEVNLPQGENLSLLRERTLAGIEEIRAKHQQGGTVIVVAHEAVNRVLLGHFLGFPLTRFRSIKQANSAINLIRFYSDSASVCLLNDTCHLKDLS